MCLKTTINIVSKNLENAVFDPVWCSITAELPHFNVIVPDLKLELCSSAVRVKPTSSLYPHVFLSAICVKATNTLYDHAFSFAFCGDHHIVGFFSVMWSFLLPSVLYRLGFPFAHQLKQPRGPFDTRDRHGLIHSVIHRSSKAYVFVILSWGYDSSNSARPGLRHQ